MELYLETRNKMQRWCTQDHGRKQIRERISAAVHDHGKGINLKIWIISLLFHN